MSFSSQIDNTLIIDIETVSATEYLTELSETGIQHWGKKCQRLNFGEHSSVEDMYFERAGIYAEFGKVISIGLGFFKEDQEDKTSLRVLTLYGHNEIALLKSFKTILEKRFPSDVRLCAHNGREFDFPYLCRRYLINDISIPKTLDVRDRKPWEINHIDTLELWKFGDRKNYTSLDLLAYSLGVSSSKADIDGSQVNTVYYKEKNIERIARYCSEDIITTAQVFLRMHQMPLIDTSCIEVLPQRNTDVENQE